MSLLALIAAILTVAAARELIGAGGEAAAGRMGRRIRAGARRPQRGIGFAALLEGRQRRLRAAGLTARFSAAELLAAKVAAACGSLPLALLDEAMRSSSGPLREELAATVAAIECGSSRAQALRALGERSRGTTLAGLAAALERARRHGSPLSRTLHEQASSLRADQRREVTERAARAAPKMQLAVALLLVPSVLLIVAAAVIANSGSLLPGF